MAFFETRPDRLASTTDHDARADDVAPIASDWWFEPDASFTFLPPVQLRGDLRR